ncbi:integration host factor subunit alpha [Alphaproteobacteria bacterium]|jgi:integration host factor subunit alpha|nr:integration host factor subunit alpha [Alphaproteobacteria bacterium]
MLMTKTLTRANLTEAVYRNIGLSRNESAELVETFLEEMCVCLENGEEVKLSSFGTFSVQSKRERVGRNPKTGVEATITPRRVLSFRPSHILKERVDSGS